MTRQYAAKRRRVLASVVNTRVSVVSRVRAGPSGCSQKFITATPKPGKCIPANVAAEIWGGGCALALFGAATKVPKTISRGGSSDKR